LAYSETQFGIFCLCGLGNTVRSTVAEVLPHVTAQRPSQTSWQVMQRNSDCWQR